MLHGSIPSMTHMSLNFHSNGALWRGVASCIAQETKRPYAVRLMTGRLAA